MPLRGGKINRMSALRRISGVAEQLEHMGVKHNDSALGDLATELASAVEELHAAHYERLEGIARYAHSDHADTVGDGLARFRSEAGQYAPRLGAVTPVTQPADPNPVA